VAEITITVTIKGERREMKSPMSADTRMRRGPRIAQFSAMFAALVLALALAACGSSSSSSSSSSAASSGGTSSATNASSTGSAGVQKATANLQPWKATPTKITITTPLKSAPSGSKMLVMLATNNPSNVQLQQSLKQLAGIVHWNYSQVSYDPANPATFGAAVDTALTKHANYIAEAGIPLTPSVIQKVQQGGAKWVLTSVYPVAVKPPVIVDANAYENDALMGKIIGDFFVSDSNGKGNAVIEHVPAYPILDGFTNGFAAEVKALCPDCKLTTANITIPDLVAGKTPSTLVSALRSNSGANYLVFDDGPFAAGINSALSAAGLHPKIIGEAADQTNIAALKAGTQTAWTGFDPVYSTYVMMDAMLRDAEGSPISQTQAAIQPTQLLTKETVGNITNWSEPANALQQFKTLWHVQ
jgi:ribose transport system substrate-binding protein